MRHFLAFGGHIVRGGNPAMAGFRGAAAAGSSVAGGGASGSDGGTTFRVFSLVRRCASKRSAIACSAVFTFAESDAAIGGVLGYGQTKEYVRLGGRVIAIESTAGGGGAARSLHLLGTGHMQRMLTQPSAAPSAWAIDFRMHDFAVGGRVFDVGRYSLYVAPDGTGKKLTV